MKLNLHSMRALSVCTIMLMMPIMVHAQGDVEDENVRDWKEALRIYTKNFAVVGDKVYANPYFDTRFQNSNHANKSQWIKDNTQKLEFDGPRVSWIKSENVAPPAEEADAYSKSLQGFDAGHYGFISGAMVTEHLSDDTVLLTGIELTDKEDLLKNQEADQKVLDQWEEELIKQARLENQKRHGTNEAYVRGPTWRSRAEAARLIQQTRYAQRSKLVSLQDRMKDSGVILTGVVSKTLPEGKPLNRRFYQLVIVDYDAERQMPVAVPASIFKKGINETQLLKILNDRGASANQFAMLYAESKEADMIEYKTTALTALKFGPFSNDPGSMGRVIGETSVGGVNENGRQRGDDTNEIDEDGLTPKERRIKDREERQRERREQAEERRRERNRN